MNQKGGYILEFLAILDASKAKLILQTYSRFNSDCLKQLCVLGTHGRYLSFCIRDTPLQGKGGGIVLFAGWK